MKNISRELLYIPLTVLFFLNRHPIVAQDIIVLRSGEEVPVKIHSTKGKMISFVLLDDQKNELKHLNKKHVRRCVLEYMKKERFSFSLSMGGLPYGTSTYLKNYMKDNGYGMSVPGFFGPIEYPTSEVQPSLLLEIEYLMAPPHGFSLEYAFANNGKVRGNGTPEISNTNQQIAVCYKYYLKNYRTNLQTGVIMDFGSIKDAENTYVVNPDFNEQSYQSWGFLIGLASPLVEKEDFFLRFQTQFRYISPIEISNEEMFLSEETLPLNHLFIGLQFGLKLVSNKN